jgi:hypothetical protein
MKPQISPERLEELGTPLWAVPKPGDITIARITPFATETEIESMAKELLELRFILDGLRK